MTCRSAYRPCAAILLALVACGESSTDDDSLVVTPDAGIDAGPRDGGVQDAGASDAGRRPDAGPDAGPSDGGETDGGVRDAGTADAGIPDSGEPPPECVFDQNCPTGEVCRFSTTPRTCVPGRSCGVDADCNICSSLRMPTDCGHGLRLTATCDANHGSVCVRGRAPCESCVVDADCGRRDPLLGGAAKTCMTYPDGNRFCTRPAPDCPDGFIVDRTTGNCIRVAGCALQNAYCPLGPPGSNCGGGQICPGDICPNTGGARCSTNNQVGEIGLCIGFCVQDADCPPARPICNVSSGICIPGCTAGGCPSTQTCHADGFCGPPCTSDAQCGATEYCNQPGGTAPRIFKAYRDTGGCAPLGCERAVDCPNGACDATQTPPACI